MRQESCPSEMRCIDITLEKWALMWPPGGHHTFQSRQMASFRLNVTFDYVVGLNCHFRTFVAFLRVSIQPAAEFLGVIFLVWLVFTQIENFDFTYGSS